MRTSRPQALIGRALATAAAVAMVLTFAAPASAAPCLTCEPDEPTVPAPAPAQVTVTGTFKYQDRTSGGTTIQDVPIVGAKVEIWRLRPRQFGITLWGKDAQTTTSANGSISVKLDYISSGITYAVRVFASNRATVVWPEQLVRTDPFWIEPGHNEGGAKQRVATSAGATLSFSHTFRDRWIAQHFNVAETLRIGRAYFDARRSDSDPLGVVNVSISATTNSSFYNYLIDEIVIDITNRPYGAFSDQAVLHEYAHHVLDQISKTTLTPAVHSTCHASDQEFAWQEGAAEFFASAVDRVNPQPWLTAHAQTDVTPPCLGVPAETVEGFITAALWDLVDTTNEPFDQLSAMDAAIVRVIDSGMDDGNNGTMYRFRSAWNAAAFDGAKLDSVLAGNKITFTS